MQVAIMANSHEAFGNRKRRRNPVPARCMNFADCADSLYSRPHTAISHYYNLMQNGLIKTVLHQEDRLQIKMNASSLFINNLR